MQRERRVLAVLAVALLLVIAGCSGAGHGNAGGASSGGSSNHAAGSPSASGSGSGSGSSSGGSSTASSSTPSAVDGQALDGRAQIRTGNVSLEVGHYNRARSDLTKAVSRMGGFVSDSSRHVNGNENHTWAVGTVVFRVPKQNFSAAMNRIEAEGTVVSSKTASKDVTQRVVDLKARQRSLLTQRSRLRDLYKRANDTNSVLEIQQRLTDVQTKLEQLNGTLRSVQNRVAYSTITVSMREPASSKRLATERSHWYDTSILSAFFGSIHGVAVVVRAVVVFLAYLVPYTVIVAPLLAVVVFLLRRWRWSTGDGSSVRDDD